MEMMNIFFFLCNLIDVDNLVTSVEVVQMHFQLRCTLVLNSIGEQWIAVEPETRK